MLTLRTCVHMHILMQLFRTRGKQKNWTNNSVDEHSGTFGCKLLQVILLSWCYRYFEDNHSNNHSLIYKTCMTSQGGKKWEKRVCVCVIWFISPPGSLVSLLILLLFSQETGSCPLPAQRITSCPLSGGGRLFVPEPLPPKQKPWVLLWGCERKQLYMGGVA